MVKTVHIILDILWYQISWTFTDLQSFTMLQQWPVLSSHSGSHLQWASCAQSSFHRACTSMASQAWCWTCQCVNSAKYVPPDIGIQILQNSILAAAPPQTPLGELTTIPRCHSQLKGDTPPHSPPAQRLWQFGVLLLAPLASRLQGVDRVQCQFGTEHVHTSFCRNGTLNVLKANTKRAKNMQSTWGMLKYACKTGEASEAGDHRQRSTFFARVGVMRLVTVISGDTGGRGWRQSIDVIWLLTPCFKLLSFYIYIWRFSPKVNVSMKCKFYICLFKFDLNLSCRLSSRRQLKTELFVRSFPDLDSSVYDRIWQLLYSLFRVAIAFCHCF